MPWYQQPFFQVGLPVILAVLFAEWHENKRFKEFKESVNQQFATINKQLEEIKIELREIRTRITRIEADLREFYRTLGQHDSRLDNLEKS